MSSKQMEKQVETSREVRIINDMEFERVPGHIGQMWDRVVSLWIEFKSKNTNPDIYFIALDKEGRGYNYYIDGRDYDLLEIYGFGSNGLPIEVYKNAISISDTSRRLVIEYKNEKKYDQESLSYTWKWIVVIHPRLESK